MLTLADPYEFVEPLIVDVMFAEAVDVGIVAATGAFISADAGAKPIPE